MKPIWLMLMFVAGVPLMPPRSPISRWNRFFRLRRNTFTAAASWNVRTATCWPAGSTVRENGTPTTSWCKGHARRRARIHGARSL